MGGFYNEGPVVWHPNPNPHYKPFLLNIAHPIRQSALGRSDIYL